MPGLIPFHYESHAIRVDIDSTGEPWWVAADIGDALDYPNIANVIKRLDDDEKGIRSAYTPGGMQEVWCVNEAGLYNLILGSRKPEAKAFKRWITHEVLPTLRQTGTYGIPTTPPRHSMQERLQHLDYLRAHKDFLADLGMLDDRDKLMLADCARMLLAAPAVSDQLALPASQDDGCFVADRVRTLGYLLTRKQEAALVGSLAKKIVAEYRTRYGGEPSKRVRFVDGATREVNYYQAKEATWMDAMIQAFFAGFPGINRAVTAGPASQEG